MRIKLFLLNVIDLITFLVFISGIVLFVRFFIINPYTVVGASMEPNFHEHDFIIVDKITPRLGSLKRGDVIVFVPEGKTLPFIKRIIGLPGEVVRIIDNEVYICDEKDICNKVDESYLPKNFITSTRVCKKDVFPLDKTGYFVLGDNREHSTDSRCCFGFACYKNANYMVHPDDIIGKVLLRLYPDMTFFQKNNEIQKQTKTVDFHQQNASGDTVDDNVLQGLEAL